MKRFKLNLLRRTSGLLRQLMFLLLMCSTQLMYAAYYGEDDFVYNGIHYRTETYASGERAEVSVINVSHQYDELGRVIPVSEGYSGNIEIPSEFYYKDFKQNSDIVIPYRVVSIDWYAFYNCSGLESVSIPESVRTIWAWAFAGCTNLTEIVLPADVDYMEESVFEGCTNLKKVTLPQKIDRILDRAFYGCSNLQEIEIPSNVTVIMDEAFEGCESLPDELFHERTNESVDKEDKDYEKGEDGGIVSNKLLLNHIDHIGRRAFARCKGIKSLTLPDNLIGLGEEAFGECENLAEVTINMKRLRVNGAFDGCHNLKRVIINEGVEQIDRRLTPEGVAEVHIPNIETLLNIQFTDMNPFWGDIELGDGWGMTQYYSLYINGEKVTNLVIPDGVDHIGDYAFQLCEGLTSVTIPNSVTSIGEGSFEGCENLANVDLPKDIKRINSHTFWGCALTSVIIPSNVTEIGNGAFGMCLKLTEVEIPNSVTILEDCVFQSCPKLTKVTIPSSVTEIGSQAFNGCVALKEIHTLNTTPPNIYKSAFSATFDEFTEQNAILYVPKGCVPVYSEHPYWGRFATILEEGISGIDGIVQSSFETIKTIYTLDGKMLNVDTPATLHKGIYIINGRKVVVK